MDSVSPSSPGRLKGVCIASDGSGDGEYDKKRKIRQWIDDIDATDSATSRSSMAGTELNSAISSEDSRAEHRTPDGLTLGGSHSDTRHPRIVTSASILDEDEANSGDDFFVEAAQQALGQGKESFTQNDYSSAAAYLTEALTMIKGLGHRQQSSCDTWELQRMLGVCAFHVNGPLDAEAALLSVLDNAPKNAILNEQQRLHVSETAHLLAQTYIKLASLENAYRYCEYALRGRRRVLGKNHHQSYESLALMARILQLQNYDLRAEFFIVMIPESVRETYVKQYADLCLPDEPPRTEESRPVAPVISPTTPIDQSLRVTMEEVAGPPPQIPERRRPRPASVQFSSGPSGSGGTLSSASPPESSEVAKRPLARLSLDIGAYSRPTCGQPRSVSDNMIPVQQQQSPNRPIYSRSSSDVYRPPMPTVNEAQHDRIQAHGPHVSMPQPLRLQRPATVSELPDDNNFTSIPNHPQAPPTPPPSLPATEEKIPLPVQDHDPPSPQLLHPNNRDSTSSGRAYTPSVYSQGTAEAPPRPSMATTVERTSSDILARTRSGSNLLRIFKTTSSSEAALNNDLSTHCNGVRLSRKDYDAIKGDFLTDTSVDYWQEHIQLTMIKGNAKFKLMRPSRARLLQTSSDPAMLKAAALPDFTTAVHVFIPLKSFLNHWSLLLVSTADSLACHYDPCPGRNRQLASKVTHRISAYLYTTLILRDVSEIPEQSSDKDSGVYVCLFMQQLVARLMETPVSEKMDAALRMKAVDVKAARKRMVKVVEESRKTREKGKEKVKGKGSMMALNRMFAYPYVGSVTGSLVR